MTRLNLTVLVAAGLLVSGGTGEGAQPEELAILMTKARSLEGRGRPDLAAQTWQQVLLADPRREEALAALAGYAKQSGRAQESAMYLERLRKVNPQHPALQQVQTMRVMSQQQSRLREAERLVAGQQFDQALMVYREVFGGVPPPGGYAIAYYETQAGVPGGWEAATAGLRKLTESYPESEEYRLSLGRLLTYRPSARMSGIRLLETINGNPALVNRARSAWRQALVWEGTNPQAASSLRTYLTRYPDPELQKLLDQTASAGAQVAAVPIRQGLARTPGENLAYTAMKNNQLAEAETLFLKALQSAPNSPGALAGLGLIRMKQDDFAGAVEYLESAEKNDGSDKLIADALGTARFYKHMQDGTEAFKANELEHAVESYRRASSMRPDNVDALQGVGGALMKLGAADDAEPVYERLLELQPMNELAWKQLVSARYGGGGAAQALATSKRIPEPVRKTLGRDVEFLALMAVVHGDLEQNPESKKLLYEAVELANARGMDLPLGLQLRFGGLFLRHGHAAESATVFETVTQKAPETIDAWEGLLGALVQQREEARARRALEKMPPDTYQLGLKRPGFLRTLAAIHIAQNDLEAAQDCLSRFVQVSADPDSPTGLEVRRQLAGIWVQLGKREAAEALLRQMARSHPENGEIRKALVGALHHFGRDRAALEEDRHIPADAQVRSDPDYLALLASCETSVGNLEEALRLMRRSISLTNEEKKTVTAGREIQFAWLLLNTQGEPRELYAQLLQIGKRSDLSAAESASLNEIWASWSQRRAQAAAIAGDHVRRVAILEGAVRMLPKDVKMRAALAGALLDAGERAKALRVYREWGLAGASAGDYAGAIAVALNGGEPKLGATWLKTARDRWPDDPQLLALAGKQAATSRDYIKAKDYWRAALVSMPRDGETQPAGAAPAELGSQSPVAAMGELLVGAGAGRATPSGTRAARQSDSDPATDPWTRPAAAWSQKNEPAAPSAPKPVLPSLRSTPATPLVEAEPKKRESRDGKGVLPVPAALAPDLVSPLEQGSSYSSLRNELENEIKAIDSRNSPLFGTGGSITGRTGEEGYERLILQEAELQASAVVGDRIRVAVIARPTYLDAGTPDGQSIKRFGLLPAGATFGSQSVGGVGGEIQVSTETFGFRFGTTPRDFLVSNFVGGIRFRPGNGPLTLMVERDVIRDSMLSFAGMRDPISNRVWGGVVATTFSAIGRWGGAESGFYAGAGYQQITGSGVQKNQRLDGNVGAYWRVMETETSTLTAGFNISAMQYDKNLRFYTLGHGGYFSPQKYLLINLPAKWRGTYRKVQFTAGGSLGVQHFQEEASPFFPTLAAVQGKNGPTYARNSATGANFGLDARVARQLTPDWYLGGWMNVNNARNFTSQSAGVFVKYTLRPRSDADTGVQSIPDWRGVEPFRLP
jgi:tetratricopeptide (TPR) repeat protein